MSGDEGDEEDEKQKKKLHGKERKVIRECVREAFWNRALPASLVTGGAVYLASYRGLYTPKGRFGPWPVVVGSSFVAYWVGKISYILGDHCQNKFLKEAPDCEISYHIRQQKGLTQPWQAQEKFGHKPHKEEEDEDVDSVETVADILTKTDVKLSNKEKQILEDCNNCAFYFFSLPLSLIFGGFLHLAQTKGWLKPSKRLQPPLSKLPKNIVGLTAGYILGQYLYLQSTDCSERFLQDAPEGEVAKALREIEQRDLLGFDVRPNEAVDVNPWQQDDYIVIKDGVVTDSTADESEFQALKRILDSELKKKSKYGDVGFH